MSISGSGSGVGTPGGPSEPSIFQLQTTAATEVARQSMGIVKDTLAVPFMLLGGNVWRYTSDMGHPVLHPMDTFRIDSSPDKEARPGQQEAFDGLVKTLPPPMQRLLKIDMQRDPRNRNPSMVALEEVLSGAARAIVTVNDASKAELPGSAQLARHRENLLLLPRSLSGAQQTAGDLAHFGDAILKEEGPNFKQFDAFFAGKEELGRVGRLLGRAHEAGGDGGEGMADRLVMGWGGLQQAITALDRQEKGAPFQIFGASLRAMQPLMAAAMPDVKAPALLMGMWTAMIGAENSEAKGGLQGGALAQVSSAVTDGVAALALPRGANPGQQLFLGLLMQVSTVLSTSFGALLAAAKPPPGVAPQDAAQYRPFTCTLTMGLISSSQAMEAFFGQAAASVQPDERADEPGRLMAAETAAQAARLAMGVGMGKKNGGEGLMRSFAPHMAAMSTALSMLEARGALTDGQAAAFSRALSEAKFALEQGDVEPFMQAWSDLVDFLGGDYAKLESDCTAVGKKAMNCGALLARGQQERESFQTSLVQPA